MGQEQNSFLSIIGPLLAVTCKWCAFLEVARERRDGRESERITDGRTERKEHNAKSTI